MLMRIKKSTALLINMASPKTKCKMDSPDESDVSSLYNKNSSTEPGVDVSRGPGGYDCQFVGKNPPDGRCPVCKLVYCLPHQMNCGHHTCAECVEDIKASGRSCPHPSCNKAVNSSFLDKHLYASA